jgi:hypothetical protein
MKSYPISVQAGMEHADVLELLGSIPLPIRLRLVAGGVPPQEAAESDEDGSSSDTDSESNSDSESETESGSGSGSGSESGSGSDSS